MDISEQLTHLRGMIRTGDTALQTARHAIQKYDKLTAGHRRMLDAEEHKWYMHAAITKNWHERDRTYMESLRAKKSAAFQAMLSAEGWARALSVVLNEESGRISTLWRWMDLEELQSYEDGTFQSRVENDGGRRGYKAFSMGENPYARERPVAVSVPIDWAVRSAIKTASYTALPRPLQPSAERIGDEKHVRYARETECRVPDGVRVPRGTRMRVDIAKLRRDTDMARLRSVCRSLESVADVSFI